MTLPSHTPLLRRVAAEWVLGLLLANSPFNSVPPTLKAAPSPSQA